MKTLDYLFCILFYYIEEKGKEGIEYFFNLNILNDLIMILDNFSFLILQKFIRLINLIISKGTIEQVQFIIQIPEIIEQIINYSLQIDEESKYYNTISSIFEIILNYIVKTRNKVIPNELITKFYDISESNPIIHNFFSSIMNLYKI